MISRIRSTGISDWLNLIIMNGIFEMHRQKFKNKRRIMIQIVNSSLKSIRLMQTMSAASR